MRLSHFRLIATLVLALTIPFVASAAWGHGFELQVNDYFDPTAFSMFLDQNQVLDNGGTPSPNNNLFWEKFGAPNNGVNATSYGGSSNATAYTSHEGFAFGVAGNNGLPAYTNATFNMISPLYYSNGVDPVAPASPGTYMEVFDRDNGAGGTNEAGNFPWTSLPPADVNGNPLGGPSFDMTGSTSFYGGFPVSFADPHELEKDLYIAGNSSQTDGEYAWAFDVTVTFADGNVVTYGPMVDVISLPNFASGASLSLQDAATEALFGAMPTAVPEPSTFALAGFGFLAVVYFGLRARSIDLVRRRT